MTALHHVRRRLVVPLALVLTLAGAAVLGPQLRPFAAAAARTSAPPPGSTIGNVDVVKAQLGGMRMQGWGYDPDVPRTPIKVTGWVDGAYTGTVVTANIARPDVGRVFPAAGPNHGFDITIPVPEGRHTVCVHLGNYGRGGSTQLPCTTATFYYSPSGALDSVTVTPGHLRAKGWAIDGDAFHTPLSIRVTLDGAGSTLLADVTRTDVAARYPNTGTQHGFDHTWAVGQGTHTLCATAVNLGYGHDSALGCRTVVVDDRPVVSLNAPQQVGNKLRIRGWAFDRDSVSTPLVTVVTVDARAPITVTANVTRTDVAQAYAGAGSNHGFDFLLALPEGRHQVCAVARNIGYGSDRSMGCRTGVLDFTPKAAVTALTPTPTGVSVTGWAYDPDTTAPITALVTLDGRTLASPVANATGGAQSGHGLTLSLATTSGQHTVCLIGVNVLYGTHNSPPACSTVTLALSPLGAFDGVTRAPDGTSLLVSGWAFDPDTTGPSSVAIRVDGVTTWVVASSSRPDVARAYPSAGAAHGLSAVVPASDGEHSVCVVAGNVGAGSNTALGCKIINAVHPVAPSAPQSVSALAGFGGATISWAAPVSDGGAPVASYTVTASPSGLQTTVPAGTTNAVIVGLNASTQYTFSVVATNVAGPSVAGVSATVRTDAGPPAQRTPAPISTSRYIRNIRGSSPAELATMRAEGATDAAHNPSGHGYLVLLDIGGQDAADNGVVLSATTRFVAYSDLVRDVQAYLDGYASAQKPSAPVVVAIGTNNDMDVSAATGRTWATTVVAPLASYARRYVGMTIAGANDIEPGFRASYAATKAWLSGYLGGTTAPFIFNGSADGCAWTFTNGSCNNGWTMAGLHYLAAAAAPTRSLNLPQIYNSTMADQWKYISLTGVVNGLPRINFAGVLTEWTACAQAGGCGSMTGNSAWSRMWSDLQSDSRLAVSSLPYSTDLRIDR